MLGDKTVDIAGSLAVVWCNSHDTTPEAPKKVYDLYTNNDLLAAFRITMNVEGKEMWILDEGPAGICLTWYRTNGGETHFTVPEDLDDALSPKPGAPASVWARAVAEAHERICIGRQNGCGCTEARRKLDESGLLHSTRL